MAQIPTGLKKVGPYWHYNLKVNGQRAHGSTRASDLATAKKVLEQKRRELLEGQHRIVSRIPTLRALYGEWTRVYTPVFSEKHCKTVECIFRRWIDPSLGSKLVDQIQTSDVLRMRSDQLAKGCSPRYANNTLQVVKLLLNFAVKLRQLKELPFDIAPIRIQKKPRVTVPAPRISEFLASIDQEARNPHVRVLLRVMTGLGLREGEALGMRWEWFDMDNRTYSVGKAKGRESRVLPVPEWLWTTIFALPKTLSPWVFPAEDGNPHRSQFCKKVLRRVCERLGFGNVTQHRLRATFATLHAETGTPVTAIQNMLGHKTLQVTQLYLEDSLGVKRRAQDLHSAHRPTNIS